MNTNDPMFWLLLAAACWALLAMILLIGGLLARFIGGGRE